MPKMISIARIDPSKLPDDPMAVHNAQFSAFATMLAAIPHGDDPNQMAVLFDVHDVEGMRHMSRTPEGDAAIREMGFVEQLDFFLEK